MKKITIEYRHVPPGDMFTPIMYLPIQKTTIDVGEPCRQHECKIALMRDYPDFRYEYLHIQDNYEY